MAPITLQRLVKELDKLKPEADAARLKTHDYARWLARMIRRLRERGLDADRAAATVALAEALKRGAITAPVGRTFTCGLGWRDDEAHDLGRTHHRSGQRHLEGLSRGPYHGLREGRIWIAVRARDGPRAQAPLHSLFASGIQEYRRIPR